MSTPKKHCYNSDITGPAEMLEQQFFCWRNALKFGENSAQKENRLSRKLSLSW